MLKVVVFDGGWGGAIISSYLQRELQVLEVMRVIDWENAPYEDKSLTQVCQFSDACLQQYINKVDLIILGGYTVSAALGFLQNKYPQQKFIGVDVNYHRILKSTTYPERITVFMNKSLQKTDFCENLRRNLPQSVLTIPDCSGWEELANQGELSEEVLRAELETYFEVKRKIKQKSLLEEFKQEQPQEEKELIQSDVVLILNTNLWDNKEDFEEIFGYKVRVLDLRETLLRDTCEALRLLGVDGKRKK